MYIFSEIYIWAKNIFSPRYNYKKFIYSRNLSRELFGGLTAFVLRSGTCDSNYAKQ